MRSLLIATAALVLSFCLVSPSDAQFFAPWQPWAPFGGARPIPYHTRNAFWYNGQLFQITRYGFIYPGSGYTYGWTHVYSPTYGVVTGLHQANINQIYSPITGIPYPGYSPYQFTPMYVSPGYYYAAQAAQGQQPSTTFFRTPTYSFPTYYVPTY
ncbi:MAG: hypothetical protein NZM31_01445 [Gemmatales bacterium]|nr:hypothetical protein [Gemmatales bacterium]MDW8385661.1 hypothetical protein [Gemmatales bacterium]